MRLNEADKWFLFLVKNYPSLEIYSVRASGRGFRVTFNSGELTLQQFQKKFNKIKINK